MRSARFRIEVAVVVLEVAVLLVAYGIFPTIVVVAALSRRGWAKWGHLAVGCTLAGWIAVQVGLLLGVLIALLALVLIRRAKSGES